MGKGKGKKTNVFEEDNRKKKGVLQSLDDWLDKNDMDQTQFLAFLAQDFPNEERRISASYHHLLSLEYKKFWSTMKFNQFIRKSLDSFLQCARKKRFNQFYRENFIEQNEINVSNYYNQIEEQMNEISQMVLRIYIYVVDSDIINPTQFESFKVAEIIYDEWIIDLVKLIDIMAIYGDSNPVVVTYIINKTLKILPDQDKDMGEIINILSKKCLEPVYKEILQITKKDKLDILLTDDDLQNKMRILTSLQDVFTTVNNINKFMPFFMNQFYNNEVINQYFEQIFYEIILARTENWQMGPFRSDMLVVIDNILRLILDYFQNFFTFIKEKLSNPKGSAQQKQKLQKIVARQVKEMGKILSLGKKALDRRAWYLIEYLSDTFDFEIYFSLVPVPELEHVHHDEFNVFFVNVCSVIEERKRRLVNMQVENKGIEEELQDYSFDEELFEEEDEAQKQQRIKEQKEKEEQQKKELQKMREEEEKLAIERKKPLLELYRKKSSDYTRKLSLDNQESQEFMKIQKLEYDDEPDDQANYQPHIPGNYEQENSSTDEDPDAEKKELEKLEDKKEDSHKVVKDENRESKRSELKDPWGDLDKGSRRRGHQDSYKPRPDRYQEKYQERISRNTRDSTYTVAIKKKKGPAGNKKQEIYREDLEQPELYKRKYREEIPEEKEEEKQEDKNEEKEEQTKEEKVDNNWEGKDDKGDYQRKNLTDIQTEEVQEQQLEELKQEELKHKKGTKININRDIQALESKTFGEWDTELITDQKEFDPLKHEQYKLRILNQQQFEEELLALINKKKRTPTPTPSPSESDEEKVMSVKSGYTFTSTEKMSESEREPEDENSEFDVSDEEEQYQNKRNHNKRQDDEQDFKRNREMLNKNYYQKKNFPQDRQKQNYKNKMDYERNQQEQQRSRSQTPEDEPQQQTESKHKKHKMFAYEDEKAPTYLMQQYKHLRNMNDQSQKKVNNNQMYEDDYQENVQDRQNKDQKKKYQKHYQDQETQGDQQEKERDFEYDKGGYRLDRRDNDYDKPRYKDSRDDDYRDYDRRDNYNRKDNYNDRGNRGGNKNYNNNRDNNYYKPKDEYYKEKDKNRDNYQDNYKKKDNYYNKNEYREKDRDYDNYRDNRDDNRNNDQYKDRDYNNRDRGYYQGDGKKQDNYGRGGGGGRGGGYNKGRGGGKNRY